MTADDKCQIKKPIPPDGGWGWMVVLGFSLSNVIAIPIIQNFGLLFRDLFVRLGIEATDMSIIVNLNASFGYLLGLLIGPILRIYGYRKVAIMGGITLFCGSTLTSIANSFTTFIIYYGLISSLGFVLITNSFSLAMNTYFLQKRNTATGIAMTITGLGTVSFPIIVSYLIPVYGIQGTSMILAGLSMHTIAGAMFLQPIKWHYIKPEDDEKNAEKEVLAEEKDNSPLTEDNLVTDDRHSIYERDLVPRKLSFSSDVRRNMSSSEYGSKMSLNDVVKPDSTWWSSSRTSLNSIKLQNDSPKTIRNNIVKRATSANKLTRELEEHNTLLKIEIKEEEDVFESSNSTIKASDKKDSCWKKIARFFELDLFKDPSFVSVSIGLSFAVTGEYNFSLMTPFIFGDRHFNIKQTAIFMSIIGTADIITRFFSPFFGNWTKWTTKNLYLFALVLLTVARFTLTFVESYEATVIVTICLGIAKGIRTVYMTLVLPNAVPIERLASAAGLQAAMNGICLISIGPIIGYVRDATGNYNYCIYIMNLLSLVTIVLWTSELVYGYFKSKKEQLPKST